MKRKIISVLLLTTLLLSLSGCEKNTVSHSEVNNNVNSNSDVTDELETETTPILEFVKNTESTETESVESSQETVSEIETETQEETEIETQVEEESQETVVEEETVAESTPSTETEPVVSETQVEEESHEPVIEDETVAENRPSNIIDRSQSSDIATYIDDWTDGTYWYQDIGLDGSWVLDDGPYTVYSDMHKTSIITITPFGSFYGHIQCLDNGMIYGTYSTGNIVDGMWEQAYGWIEP